MKRATHPTARRHPGTPFFILLSLFIAASVAGRAHVDAADDPPAGDRPNILFILADDLGIEGIGAYGGESVETPHIDNLAGQGMRFTRCFANPYCTPSRSELLTGRYPFRTGTPRVIWDMDMHDQFLDVSEPSFARQLQQAGYATAIAGKWQLTFLAERDTVHAFGFDTYMHWQIVTAENERTTRYHNPHFRTDGRIIADEIADQYGPDVLVDYLVDFMRTNRDGPFLAYYTALLPHYPWVPTPDSDDQAMPDNKRHGDPKFFPDMVRRLDHNVGRLLDALDELGIADDTIVIFLADNGTDQQLTNRWNGHDVPGGKSSFTDRGTLVPFIIRWPGRIAPGSVDGELVELADFFPTLVELAGADMPEQPIHGQSFASRLRQEAGPEKPYVHIEKMGGRYLRSHDWMVNNEGVSHAVQPYPTDAEPVTPADLSDDERAELTHLQSRLAALHSSGEVRLPESLAGMVLTLDDARLEGPWQRNDKVEPFVAPAYAHDGDAAKGEASARFEAELEPGTYEVQLAYVPHQNRATDVGVTVHHADGQAEFTLNQQREPSIQRLFHSLGTFTFDGNTPAAVVISNADTDGHVIVNAVRFLPADEEPADAGL